MMKVFLSQIKTHTRLLQRFTCDNQKAQKSLLSGIECVVQLHTAVLLPKISHILKMLYDCDIVEEEVLLDWAQKPSRSKHVSKELSADIHTKAQPFIKWLKEAEEESEEDEEDDSDVEIEYDDRARAATLKEQGKTPTPASVKPVTTTVTRQEPEETEELDIDAI